MRKLFTLLTLFVSIQLSAQQWDSNPDYSAILKTITDPAEKCVNVLDERVISFTYLPNQDLAEDLFIHQVYYLNSTEAIDALNKIYIPLSASSKLLNYNARVISPSGTVRVLSNDDLKEAVNEQGQNVKFFAMSGVEVGGIVEFYYTIRRIPNMTGRLIVFQKTAPTVKAIFRLVSPSNLVFKTLSVNGYPEIKADTAARGENRVIVGIRENIPALTFEKFSNSDAHAMGVLYQLDGNTFTGASNIYNYTGASEMVYKSLNEELSKKVNKELDKILKASGYADARDERAKIFAIEDYVKRNFLYAENVDPQLETLEKAIEKKTLNDNLSTRLLYRLYKMAGIQTEIVLTCDRTSLVFDPVFESYAFLNDYLLYFPGIDDYSMPSYRYFRVGLIPPDYLDNHGLFIRKVSLGSIESGAGEIRKIKAYPAEHSTNTMLVNVKSLTPGITPDRTSRPIHLLKKQGSRISTGRS
ncbi:MAG: DUF3857 domain-containing protein [Bacteroidota bacterium]